MKKVIGGGAGKVGRRLAQQLAERPSAARDLPSTRTDR